MMKVALFISARSDADAATTNYRSVAFLNALRSEGIEVRAWATRGASNRDGLRWTSITEGGTAGFGRDDTRPVNDAHDEDVENALRDFRPDIVQTIGYAADVAAPWLFASRVGTPVIHHVLSGGPVGDDPRHLIDSWRREPAIAGLFAQPRLRRASRAVVGLIGSNGVDIARARSRGYYANARFSVIGLPPVEAPHLRAPSRSAIAPAGQSSPVFGYFDPRGSAATLAMVVEAAGLFGASPCRVCVPKTLASLRIARDGRGVEVIDTENADDFVANIDVLVVPYADDGFAEAMIKALQTGRRVIAPDYGVTAEILDFGRRGELFELGNAAALALAMQNVSASWRQQPIFFDAAEIAALTSAQTVARRCVDVYARARVD